MTTLMKMVRTSSSVVNDGESLVLSSREVPNILCLTIAFYRRYIWQPRPTTEAAIALICQLITLQ